MSSKIRVFILMDAQHPYIKMLIRNLKKFKKINVMHFRKAARKEFPKRVKDILRSQIIHFHWINYLVRSNSHLLTWILIVFWLSFTKFLKKVGKKIVITLHDIHPRDQIYSYAIYFYFVQFLKLCDLIIVHNKFTELYSKRYYRLKKPRYKLIPHGDFYEYYSKITPQKVRIDENKLNGPKILFVGNIRKYKGLEKLIRIIEKSGDIQEVTFIVAGRCMDIEMCSKLKKMAEEYQNVVFISRFLDDGEIRYLVETSDVGIIPYRTTTTPGSMILFLSHGKPVIVPKKPPLTEYCRKAKACLMYREDHWEEDIINIIKKIANKEIRLEEMSENAKKYTRKLKWWKIAKSTINSYLKTLKDNKKPIP